MHLRLVLQQTRPVLLLEILLSQHHLDVGGGVVCLGVVDVDLGEEVDLEVVGGLFCVRGAGEGQTGGLKVELE